MPTYQLWAAWISEKRFARNQRFGWTTSPESVERYLKRNLPRPIPEFRSDATLGYMREVTGKVSEKDVARQAKKIRPAE